MGLAAMMRLMVEQMQENVGQNLRLWHFRCGSVTVKATQGSFVIFSGDFDQPIVFCDTSLG